MMSKALKAWGERAGAGSGLDSPPSLPQARAEAENERRAAPRAGAEEGADALPLPPDSRTAAHPSRCCLLQYLAVHLRH
jgi:hypothetical protein